MALTLTEQDALTVNAAFRGRVRGAILQHANDILLTELQSVAQHNRRVAWAQRSTTGPDALGVAADQMILGVVMRPLVQAAASGGSAVTDADLLTSVGQLINAYA
jgi:hypothetical protein